MKYALISDIHSNQPALEAVLASIRGQGDIAAVYHLGDLVGYAPWPNETAELIQQLAIAGVAGNYDSTVGTDYKHCGCRYEDPVQEELSHASYSWTRRHVSHDTRAFLAGLPFRIDLLPNGGHTARPPCSSGACQPHPEYHLLDRRSGRRFLLEDGQSGGNESRRRDRVRSHAYPLATRDRWYPFSKYR